MGRGRRSRDIPVPTVEGDSQGPQPVQAPEHAAAHRLQLVDGEVQLADGRGPLERPVLDLRHLVVAEVAAGRRKQQAGTGGLCPGCTPNPATLSPTEHPMMAGFPRGGGCVPVSHPDIRTPCTFPPPRHSRQGRACLILTFSSDEEAS